MPPAREIRISFRIDNDADGHPHGGICRPVKTSTTGNGPSGQAAQSHLTGALATSRQGQAVIREALASTTVAGAASFLGALLPPAVGVVLPGPSWVPLAISVATLGAPGAGIGAAMGRALAR